MFNECKNILFLDMDGVLNSNYLIRKWYDDKFLELQDKKPHLNLSEIRELVSQKYYQEFKHNKELIFPELAKRLNEVIEKCNVKIIWSSTWRYVSPYRNINNARTMLERRGINGSALIGYTPNFSRFTDGGNYGRMSEILSFVKNNTLGITFEDRLAAIDDLNLKELENDNIKFFGTEVEFGLTENIKNQMIEYYERSDKKL
mgnify:CR=1 FL=1